MLQKLFPPFEPATRSLFEPLSADYPMCRSVLAGVYPAKVFVDEPANPKTGLLMTFFDQSAVWAFLVGSPSNKDFNQALQQATSEHKILGRNTGAMFFNCYPSDWREQLPIIIAPHETIPMCRKHYVARKIDFDWRARLRDGFLVNRLGPSMLSRPDFYVPREVRSALAKWQRMSSPDFQDFGFGIVHQNAIVSWATAEYVADGRGDLRYYTVGNYRRRGLGTIVAAAAIEHGLSNGLSEIHWTCAARNTGSIRTAERLGLEYVHGDESCLLIFNEGRHLSKRSNYALSRKRPNQAADTLDQYVATASNPAVTTCHDAAQEWAALTDRN